jgi:hypothetical protein
MPQNDSNGARNQKTEQKLSIRNAPSSSTARDFLPRQGADLAQMWNAEKMYDS